MIFVVLNKKIVPKQNHIIWKVVHDWELIAIPCKIVARLIFRDFEPCFGVWIRLYHYSTASKKKYVSRKTQTNKDIQRTQSGDSYRGFGKIFTADCFINRPIAYLAWSNRNHESKMGDFAQSFADIDKNIIQRNTPDNYLEPLDIEHERWAWHGSWH